MSSLQSVNCNSRPTGLCSKTKIQSVGVNPSPRKESVDPVVICRSFGSLCGRQLCSSCFIL
ncbi:hypothetical protein AMELA_G00009790 [Ameiurus melas]|uniref:Uncharacterized protein n=1 Tax=Ameiurus melas TaxID=219545 RepID=A0A7J6BGY3_AMEME|nr:hypothetical protein AMELA_G00009790 [Ameiurus melas]